VNILTQDMVDSADKHLSFNYQPVKFEGFKCYQMLVSAESGNRLVYVSVYYRDGIIVDAENYPYVIDHDDLLNPFNQLWLLISTVCRGKEEAFHFLRRFAGHFGFDLVSTLGQGKVLFVAQPFSQPWRSQTNQRQGRFRRGRPRNCESINNHLASYLAAYPKEKLS